MKKIFIMVMLLSVTTIQAKIYNGVAIVVNGVPITLAEIRAVKKQLGVSTQDAKDMLIQNRLQKSAMKDIKVSEDEIDKRIEGIAKQNNLSLKKMQSEVKKQGESWNRFRDQIKTSLQKQKFFRTKIAKTIQEPSSDELQIFYRNHPKQFSMPSSIKVVEYSASTAGKVQDFLSNPSDASGVKRKNVTFSGSDVTPQLLAMMSQTSVGAFTPAFNNGSAYVTYMVRSKGKGVLKPFADVKNSVIMAWKREQQGEAVDSYFKKMKSEATIEILRK